MPASIKLNKLPLNGGKERRMAEVPQHAQEGTAFSNRLQNQKADHEPATWLFVKNNQNGKKHWTWKHKKHKLS